MIDDSVTLPSRRRIELMRFSATAVTAGCVLFAYLVALRRRRAPALARVQHIEIPGRGAGRIRRRYRTGRGTGRLGPGRSARTADRTPATPLADHRTSGAARLAGWPAVRARRGCRRPP